MKKLRADHVWGMSVACLPRIFCLPVYCLNTQSLKIQRINIFPIVVCGSETWSLILKEEHRLRVFENRVLWKLLVLTGRN
jgi:hypothetical protein